MSIPVFMCWIVNQCRPTGSTEPLYANKITPFSPNSKYYSKFFPSTRSPPDKSIALAFCGHPAKVHSKFSTIYPMICIHPALTTTKNSPRYSRRKVAKSFDNLPGYPCPQEKKEFPLTYVIYMCVCVVVVLFYIRCSLHLFHRKFNVSKNTVYAICPIPRTNPPSHSCLTPTITNPSENPIPQRAREWIEPFRLRPPYLLSALAENAIQHPPWGLEFLHHKYHYSIVLHAWIRGVLGPG
jgi:hypothetical protein